MSEQKQLLVVQALDIHLDQLRHRRGRLEQRARIVEIERETTQLNDGVADALTERDNVARDQKRLEDEVATVEAKIERDNERLYAGDITSPKEAQGITEEIASLKRRVGDLEEGVLERLLELEPLDAQIADRDQSVASLAEENQRVSQELTVAEAEIDSEIETETVARATATEGISGDLLAEYERLRGLLDGVGVAKLDHKTCLGCHLQLAAMEFDRVSKEPEDAIVHCEECGRLLVR